MRRTVAALIALLLPAVAVAQPSPTFTTLHVTGASTLSGGGTLTGTFTGTGATITGGTFSGITLSGTIAGSPTTSGTWAFQGNLTVRSNGTCPVSVNGGGSVNFTSTVTNCQIAITAPAGSGSLVLQAATPASGSGWIKANGTLALKQNTVITSGAALGTGGLSPAAIWEDIAWSGTQDTGTAAPNFFRVTDAVVGSTSPGFPIAIFDREYNAGADGPRIGLQVVGNKNAASLSGSNEFVEFQVFGHYLAGEGGSAGNYKGSFWGENIDVSCQTGCDYIDRLKGTEWDIRSYTGTHLNAKIVTNVHWAQFDAVHGAVEDIGLAFDAATGIASGTGKGATLISIGKYNGDQPFDPSLTTTSAIMQVRPNISANLTVPWQPYAAYGMDLSFMNFAQAAWWSSGFKIDGTGQVPIMGPGAISYSANTITIDAPNVVETSAVVAAGGATYQVGDEIKDTIGGLWSVATLTGNAVATVTLLKAGYATTCPVSPTATTGGGGNAGATLTITCSATTKGIKLAGAATALGFYGTTPIVKATPAGACAGNTGCQALRDALGNLGLINTGSITN